jgi:hypothetical protein
LVRVAGGPVAAGIAAFAVGFIFQIWLTDGGPATAVPRSDDVLSANGIAASQPRLDAHQQADLQAGNNPEFAQRWPQTAAEPATPHASFGERFAFNPPAAEPARPAQATASFDDRFTPATSSAAVQSAAAAASPRATVGRAAKAMPAPRVAADAARKPAAKMQLASASATSLPLAYAPDEKANNLGLTDPKGPAAKDSDPFAGLDAGKTAIYEITSRTVYMPNGRRLEAHSGLGSHMDDPRYVAMKSTGPTPPNVYALRMRESLFHGVRAIRLIPKDEAKMNGRAGILAHSYMLGASGQSNGCVSFADYPAFLDAYERGDVTHLVVVERLADAPGLKIGSDWLSNAFRDLFRRS